MKDTGDKVVFLTGASSGIGHASALLLARSEFQVFAGVRTPEDGTKLQAETGNRLVPVIIDVADARSIKAAAEEVTARLTG